MLSFHYALFEKRTDSISNFVGHLVDTEIAISRFSLFKHQKVLFGIQRIINAKTNIHFYMC